MEQILQGVQTLDGVLGTAVLGAVGQVIAHGASAIYDASILGLIGSSVAKALDSLQLAQEEWDTVTGNFSEGKLILHNLCTRGAMAPSGGRALLVIADPRLNPSFATVAIRVAATKLKTAPAPSFTRSVERPVQPSNPNLSNSSLSRSSPHFGHSNPGFTQSTPLTSSIASNGLAWSGGTSSVLGGSGVAVADPASAVFLTTCTKALALAVGPMAKAFVKNAIRKLWPDRPFSLDLAPELALELETNIEDPDDRAEFRKAMRAAF